MSHRSLFWPISLIVIIAITLVLIIISVPVGPHVVNASDETLCPTEDANYPSCYKTQTALASGSTSTTNPANIIMGCPTEGPNYSDLPYPPYEECLKTRTALLLQTELAGASPTSTSPPSSGGSGSNNATSTPTSTWTPTKTAAPNTTSSATNTIEPTATNQDTSLSETPTVTATLETGDPEADTNTISCIPGETIILEGTTDLGPAMIITFGDRPVGGGFRRNDGSYRLRLRIGNERPGIYPVRVEDRVSNEVIQEVSCQVPAFTPTPTPPLIP